MEFNQKNGAEKILTLVGKDTVIRGTLQDNGAVRIDGKIFGEVDVDGEVIIGEGAGLEASVKAKNAQVAGRVTGNLPATGRLEIQPTGDVRVRSLQAVDWVVFRGSCVMKQVAPA